MAAFSVSGPVGAGEGGRERSTGSARRASGLRRPARRSFSGTQGANRNTPFTEEHDPTYSPSGARRRAASEWPRMTADMLKECNKKALARMARERGITGWHAMRKDQLIRALGNGAPRSGKATSATSPRRAKAPEPAKVATTPAPRRRRRPDAARPRALEPAVARRLAHGCDKDRIITMVRDPHWLHTYWELSRSTMARAQAALGPEWHTAQPILRLMDVSSDDTTAASEGHVRDIPVHGGVNNWYIDVNNGQRSYRVDVGYLSRKGKFYVLARSNVVTTPRAGSSDMFDQTWLGLERDYERIYHQSGGNDHAGLHSALRELFEERLRRPMNALSLQGLAGSLLPGLGRRFHFELDAELVVYGATEPNAKVTLQGEPVQVRPDGSFTVRFALPDARQIIPAVATSADGVEERTIVLAVERNTKELEPTIHDGNEL
jgi:hypothetical protein